MIVGCFPVSYCLLILEVHVVFGKHNKRIKNVVTIFNFQVFIHDKISDQMKSNQIINDG